MFEFTEMQFWLGVQNSAPPLSGQPAATSESTGAPGGTPGTGGTQQPPPSGDFLWIIMLGFAVLMIVMMWTQRREKKRRNEMMGGVRKHDRVRTIGGVIGSVVEVKPDTIVLKVDESSNTRITFSRTAVQEVLQSSSAGGPSDAGAA